MVCPKCGNKIGFAVGMCIECGYNCNTHSYDKIWIDTGILKEYLPVSICNVLIADHERRTGSVERQDSCV